MTGKERNFRTHNANTRNTRIRKSKLSSKGGTRMGSLANEIKEWELSQHFRHPDELFIFERPSKNSKRLMIGSLLKSRIYKTEKSAAKSVTTSLNLPNSVSYLSYLFDGTFAEHYHKTNASTLSNKFFHGTHKPLSKEPPKKSLIFETFKNSYIIKPTSNLQDSNPWKLATKDASSLCNNIYNAIDNDKLNEAYKYLDQSTNGSRVLLFSILGLIHFQYFKMQLFSVENEFLSNIFLERKFGQNTIVDMGGELSEWIPFIIHFQKYFEDVWNRNSLGFNPPGIKAEMTTGMSSCEHMIENTQDYTSFGGNKKNIKKGGGLEWGTFIGLSRNAAMIVEKNLQEPLISSINPLNRTSHIDSYKFNDPYSLNPFMMMLLHKTYLCLRLSRKYLITSMYLGEVRALITINKDLSITRMEHRHNKNNEKLKDVKYINKEAFIRKGDISQIAKGAVLEEYSKIIDRCIEHFGESPLSVNDPNFKKYLLENEKDKLTNPDILRQIRLRSIIKPLTYRPTVSSNMNLSSYSSSFQDTVPDTSSTTNPFNAYTSPNMGYSIGNFMGGNKKNKKEKKVKKSKKKN